MPSVEVLETSAVATKQGWRCAGALERVSDVLVLDRFGALVAAPILVEISGAQQPACFLGSRSAFGPFVGSSLVHEYDGTLCQMSDLVDSGEVRERRYEATLSSAARAFEQVVADGLWAAIESIAALEVNSDVVVRCVDTSAQAPMGIRTAIRSGIRYVVLARHDLNERMKGEWSAFTLELGRVLFRREEEDRLEIPICAGVFGLWYATAMCAAGRGFRFGYDSIQHSSYVFVHDDNDPSASAGGVAGLTAFRRPSRARVVTLIWSEPTWNPVVNGFIMSGT